MDELAKIFNEIVSYLFKKIDHLSGDSLDSKLDKMKVQEELLLDELYAMKHKEQLLQQELDALKEISKECPPERLPLMQDQECQTLLPLLSSSIAVGKDTRSMVEIVKGSSPLKSIQKSVY